MIRDNNKIYGEPNMPNTVVAAQSLVVNKYIIGAGNTGIKTFDPGPKRLIITNSSGVADGFLYNEPNKIIGTDSSGNLTLTNPIVPYKFFQFGGTNRAVSVNNTNMGNASIINYEGFSGCVSTAADSSWQARSCGKVTFEKGLDFSSGQRSINYFISYAGIGGMTQGIDILTTNDTAVTLYTGQSSSSWSNFGLSIYGSIVLPAGVYNKIDVVPNLLQSLAVNQSSLVGGMIWYQ